MATTSRQQPQAAVTPHEVSETVEDTLEENRYHLVFGVSSEMYEILDKLARRYHGDKAHVLNLAVGLLNTFANAVDEGKRVGIATDEQELDTEITGL